MEGQLVRRHLSIQHCATARLEWRASAQRESTFRDRSPPRCCDRPGQAEAETSIAHTCGTGATADIATCKATTNAAHSTSPAPTGNACQSGVSTRYRRPSCEEDLHSATYCRIQTEQEGYFAILLQRLRARSGTIGGKNQGPGPTTRTVQSAQPTSRSQEGTSAKSACISGCAVQELQNGPGQASRDAVRAQGAPNIRSTSSSWTSQHRRVQS